MGYMRHHAIAVTSWDEKLLTEAHNKAIEIFSPPIEPFSFPVCLVSAILEAGINGYQSFFIAPDGSKEGWELSDEANMRRYEFIEWLDQQRYCDGSTALDWAEVQYGDEFGDNRMIRNDSKEAS